MQRRLRGAGWVAFTMALTGLGAGDGACGGRQVFLGVQDEAGTSGASASSGSSTGSGSSAGGGSAGTGSTQFAAGSVNAGPSGSVDTAPASRCAFAPELGSAPAPTASADVVLARVVRFLDDSSAPPVDVQPPTQVTADWAGTLATAILDQHFANGTEAPGLVRFLTAWLNIPAPDAGLSAAHAWSVKLLDPSATLTTLLAGPTGDSHRIGILTDPQFLTAFARISNRGHWMVENLWCSEIPAPPQNTPLTLPMPMPGVTRREQLQSYLTSPACSACHNLMDMPGFSLEHFDAMGNYRDLDNGKPVDSSGTLLNPVLTFTSYDDLAPQLASSCRVARCFANLVMSDAFAVSAGGSDTFGGGSGTFGGSGISSGTCGGSGVISSSGTCGGNGATTQNLPFTDEEANHVANAFANSNFSIRELVKAVVGTPSFLR